jgi:hypothetical protein
MFFMPSTRVKVLRDTADSSNDWGDDLDTQTVIYENVPVHISENSEFVWNTSELRAERVEEFTIRVAQRFVILEGDRVVDKDGSVYQVQTASRPQSVVGATSGTLTCKRIGSQEP